LKLAYPYYFFIISYPDFAYPSNKILQLQQIPISECCRTSTSRADTFLIYHLLHLWNFHLMWTKWHTGQFQAF